MAHGLVTNDLIAVTCYAWIHTRRLSSSEKMVVEAILKRWSRVAHYTVDSIIFLQLASTCSLS